MLVAAVACLGLAMCTHSPSRSTDVQSPQYAPAQAVEPQAAPQAPQATPAARQQAVTPTQRAAPSPPAKAPPPTYFPATKAAPALYPQ